MIHASSGAGLDRHRARAGFVPTATDGAFDREVVADHGDDLGLAEDQPGPLVGVVRIDRNVGRPGSQDSEDRDVEIGRARADPDPDPVAGPDAQLGEAGGNLSRRLGQLGVRQDLGAVVQGRVVGKCLNSLVGVCRSTCEPEAQVLLGVGSRRFSLN